MVDDIIIWDGETGVSPFTRILYIGPDVKHRAHSMKLIDILLDHETLHLVLDNLGEKEASDKLDIGIPSLVIEDLRVGLEDLVKR
jgi:hypothetical protein